MTDTTLAASDTQSRAVNARFYATAWRWHFYAGLYVVPFLTMLAITGLVMVFFTGFQTRLGMTINIQPQAQVQAVTAQAKAVLAQFPQAKLKEYVAPKAADVPAWFTILDGAATQSVAVNPYTAEVIKTVDKGNTVYAWAEKIHGSLLIGDVGDALIEIAAGLGIVMIITGLYLYWPRNGGTWAEALIPDVRAKGRKFWKSMHSSLGFWLSIALALFLLTGLSWTNVWGNKFVQPWNSFPADKWEAPKSDATHASLNTAGLHDVPWGLELTPMPVSGSDAGKPGVPASQPINLDGLYALAKTLGFESQFHINVPQDATGVYTLSADTMSGDLHVPTRDRTVHVDRYTGKVLADIGFADYSLVAKAMAIGIALHQGDLGLWSAWLNVVLCLAIAFICISGIVMWWLRRPAGAARLGAPGVPANATLWKTGAVVMLVASLAFPVSGAVLLGVLLLDFVFLSRIKPLKQLVS